MPKMKTNRGAAKRFKVTASGRVKRGHAGRRHILATKRRKRKRHLRHSGMASAADLPGLRRLLPYGF